MRAADQTDWLYATPVIGICENKSEAAVTMNHAAANINVTINKGTYLREGTISNITVHSDGIALGGTFNAALAEPDYTAFEDEGEPLSRDITTTTGTATDIMVVPTVVSATITFTATIDGIQFSTKSATVTLERGNSYVYTLNLSDISTYMSVGSFGVKLWTGITKETLPLNIYIDKTIYVKAVSATNERIDYNAAEATAKGVAIIAGEHKFMIAKKDATDGTNNTLYYDYDKGDLSLTNYDKVDGTNSKGYFGGSSSPQLSQDFTTWTAGALSNFNGKANTQTVAASSNNARHMCKVLETYNAGCYNQGHNDWYVPAAGQLALMYLAKTDFNAAIAKIGGTVLESGYYWSSSERNSNCAWAVDFNWGYFSNLSYKNNYLRVRFVRDIE